MNLDTKQNKTWVDKGSKWHNKSLKWWLEINNIEMYSTRSSGVSVVAERFIRTLKNKHCKYMTSVSQNVYIDKLGNIIKKYSTTFHRSIKMNPVKKTIIKIQNLKLLIMWDYQNIKHFLQKVMFQNFVI